MGEQGGRELGQCQPRQGTRPGWSMGCWVRGLETGSNCGGPHIHMRCMAIACMTAYKKMYRLPKWKRPFVDGAIFNGDFIWAWVRTLEGIITWAHVCGSGRRDHARCSYLHLAWTHLVHTHGSLLPIRMPRTCPYKTTENHGIA